MVRKLLVLIAVSIPLTLVACGGDDSSSTTAAGDAGSTSTSTEATTTASDGGGGSPVAIAESEFKLNPSDPTAKAGAVTLDVSNAGGTVHDLEIEGNGVDESTDPIESGGSAQLSVDLKPGTYEIYCNIADHRAQGMEGTLTVQ